MRPLGFVCIFLCLTNVRGQKLCSVNATPPPAFTNISKERITGCIANCLGLLNAKKPCVYNPKSGNPMREPCAAKFLPARKDKVILCYSDDSGDRLKYEKSVSVTSCDFFTIPIVKYVKGDLVPLNPNDTNIEPQLEGLRRLGIKRILHLGSDDNSTMPLDAFNTLAENKALRLKFVETLNRTIHKYKLDGVFINWFWPGCIGTYCGIREKNKTSTVTFAREVFAPLKSQGLKIFFFVHLIETGLTFNLGDYYSDITQYVDYFPLMNVRYGMRSDLTSQLSNSFKRLKDSVAMLFKMVSDKAFHDKILLEITPQVRIYEIMDARVKDKTSARQNVASKMPEYIAFHEYLDYLRDRNWTVVNDTALQSYAYMDKIFFSFEDAASLKTKADLMKEKGGGFYIANVHADNFGDKYASCGNMHFTRVAAEYLKGGDCNVTGLCF